MDGNKKILIIAILMMLIAVSYGTYAIYKTSLSGNATVTAATWNVSFKEGQNTITDTFNLQFGAADCVNNHVANGKIAPGASCTKNITIDATGTEVDVEYTLTVDNENIKVNNAAQPANSNSITASIGSSDGTILMTDSSKTDTVAVTITWNGQEGESYDSGDTTIGEGGYNIVVPVTLVAKQTVGS